MPQASDFFGQFWLIQNVLLQLCWSAVLTLPLTLLVFLLGPVKGYGVWKKFILVVGIFVLSGSAVLGVRYLAAASRWASSAYAPDFKIVYYEVHLGQVKTESGGVRSPLLAFNVDTINAGGPSVIVQAYVIAEVNGEELGGESLRIPPEGFDVFLDQVIHPGVLKIHIDENENFLRYLLTPIGRGERASGWFLATFPKMSSEVFRSGRVKVKLTLEDVCGRSVSKEVFMSVSRKQPGEK